MSDLNTRAAECMGWVAKTRYGRNLEESVSPIAYYWIGDEVVYLDDFPLEISDWQPDTDIAQAWMLVEKCRENGLNVYVWVAKYGEQVRITTHRKNETVVTINNKTTSAPAAITAACVEALEHGL